MFAAINGKVNKINTDEQIVWEGVGNAKLSNKDSIDLQISPYYKTGDYEGELVWSLQDAPK